MYKNLAGRRFGRLVVLKYDSTRKKQAYWLCKCDCGNEKIILSSSLIRGATQSCGCLNSEKTKKRKTKHGMYGTRIYRIWSGMKTRCYNSKRPCFKNYGGKGITVCNEWKNDFMSFYNWAMNNGYTDELTIERIDNNQNYCPSNCKFVTIQQQQKNRSNNHLLTYNGQTMILRDWARKMNLPINIVSRRLLNGWSVERALNTKVMVNRYV